MARETDYVLGYRPEERERLQGQADQLGPDSARLFDDIGVRRAQRVVELGCGPRGCLGLLSARVGPSGSVLGVDISAVTVQQAQAFAEESGLGNVRLLCRDAGATALPAASFDLVTSRLVLVNIPQPERIVSEAVRLARAGGAIAFHEVDWSALICDPPCDAWTRLVELYLTMAQQNGIDFFVGRKLPRLLREAGVVDIRVHPIMHVHALGDPRRLLMLQFADNFRTRILDEGLLPEDDFDALKGDVARHLDNPETTVYVGPYVQAWGRKPA
jgi:SAM-dependent methyltransferase